MPRSGPVILPAMVLLAGCAASPASAPPQPDREEPIASRAATPANDDWTELSDDVEGSYALEVATPVAAFDVAIPPDRRSGSSQSSPVVYHHLYLQPVFTSQPRTVVAVILADGEPITAMTWGQHRTLDLDTGDEQTTMDWDDRFVQIQDEGHRRLQVVVGVDGDPLHLALHFSEEYAPLGGEDSAVQDQHAPVPANGTGGAFEMHMRQEFVTALHADVGGSSVVEVGAPAVDEALPFTNSGGARQVTITAECDLGGWGYAETFWDALLEDTVAWHHRIQAGPAEASSRGAHSSVVLYDWLATTLTFGLPEGQAIGDGGAHAMLELSGQMVPLSMDTLVVAVCFDADTEQLFGNETAPRAVLGPALVRLPGGPD